MKEDILEQIVDSWFLRQVSTFTKHNVKYKPSKEVVDKMDAKVKSKYSVSSDIDVIAVHLDKIGVEKVSVISCKSWQEGFDIDFFYKNLGENGDPEKKVGTGPAWKKFREIYDPIWAKAFRDKVFEETKSHDFTYYVAVTKFKNEKKNLLMDFINCEKFISNLNNNGTYNVRIKFLTMEEMVKPILEEPTTTTLEATEIGRFMQLIKAAGFTLCKTKNLR